MATDQELVELSGTTTASGKGRQLPERVRYALWRRIGGDAEFPAREVRDDAWHYVAWMRDDVLFHGTRHPLSNRLLLR